MYDGMALDWLFPQNGLDLWIYQYLFCRCELMFAIVYNSLVCYYSINMSQYVYKRTLLIIQEYQTGCIAPSVEELWEIGSRGIYLETCICSSSVIARELKVRREATVHHHINT